MNDIKSRIKSVKGTMQITKAMELVATSKLRRAKEMAEGAKPYMDAMTAAIKSLSATAEAKDSPYGRSSDTGRRLIVVIAGDRGLAGGYNSNVFKLAAAQDREGDAIYLPLGKKAVDFYKRRDKELLITPPTHLSSLTFSEVGEMGRTIAEEFISGRINRVEIVYTRFISMLTQLPTVVTLLPLSCDCNEAKDTLFDGDAEEILNKTAPLYLGGAMFSAICEAGASECAARRSAMSSANKNAEEMINTLMLKYNRARQAIITQEITEIVSGAEAQ